jgi:hypothetical protein
MMSELKSLVKLVYSCLLMTAILGGFEWGGTVVLCNMTGIQSMYYPLLAMAVSFNCICGVAAFHNTNEAIAAAAVAAAVAAAAAKGEEDED